MLKKFTLRLALLIVLTNTSSVTFGTADTARVNSLAAGMMCTCGCNQILNACNHIGCPNSVPMMAELAEYVEAGRGDEDIVSTFVTKYGLTVLAAPPTSGAFNISAWLMPFIFLFLGTGLVVYYLKRFRTNIPSGATEPIKGNHYHERLEEELAKYTPED